MKKTIILLAVCGITSTAGAQTMYDALTFSENTYYGTARSTAMGNAFTALGGDLGGISINPAGSAVANYSQITITPSLNIAVSTAQGTKWNGEANGFERRMKNSSTRFTLPNIGFTLNYDTHRTSGVTGISVGFMVNGTGYFNDNMILLASSWRLCKFDKAAFGGFVRGRMDVSDTNGKKPGLLGVCRQFFGFGNR